MADYIFTTIRASKVYGPECNVLDDITLAFLPGATIGVLGPNGARAARSVSPGSGVSAIQLVSSIGKSADPSRAPAGDRNN